MPTMTATAPYIVGDPVSVEIDGMWCEATVIERDFQEHSYFGTRWILLVRTSNGYEYEYRCDDNGRNYRRGQGVRPSDVIE